MFEVIVTIVVGWRSVCHGPDRASPFFSTSSTARRGRKRRWYVRGWAACARSPATGFWYFPVIHRVDRMDLSVKRIEIHRKGGQG
jgi:hypothetical protein